MIFSRNVVASIIKFNVPQILWIVKKSRISEHGNKSLISKILIIKGQMLIG